MATLKDLFESKGYKAFVKKIFLWSIITLVIGLFFIYMKYPGAYTITAIAGGSLCVLLILKLFEKIWSRKNNDDFRDN